MTLFKAVAWRVLVGGLAAVALSACQTTGTDVDETEAGTLDIVVPSENEPAALGRSHLAQGDSGLAQRQFQAAVEKNPNDGASWVGLAAAYDNLGRFDLADRAYKRAIGLEGETLEILNNRGYSYLLRGNGRLSLRYFRRALASSPGNAMILNNIRLLELGQLPARATPL